MAEGEPTGTPESKKGEEELANWLVPDRQEFNGVGNPKLKTEIHLLARHGDRTTATPDRLLKAHERIEEMARNGEISIEDAGIWLGRIERQHQKLIEAEGIGQPRGAISPETEASFQGAASALGMSAIGMERVVHAQERMERGEYRLVNLPPRTEVVEQRAYVREILDNIEKSNRDSHDYAVAPMVRGLEASLGDMDESIAKEVRARLALHDCAELMKQTRGWIFRDTEKVGPGYAIGSAAAEADNRGHALEPETIRLLLEKGLQGLAISKAWDLLQETNYSYKKALTAARSTIEAIIRSKTPGPNLANEIDRAKKALAVTKQDKEKIEKKDFRFFKDGNLERKRYVRMYLLEMLKQNLAATQNLTGEDLENAATKSLQLAEKLTVATLENSVFDRGDPLGNDELAEIIGFREYRKHRAASGRTRGPIIHEDAIGGFGTSWLRLDKYDVYMEPTSPLMSKDIKFDKISEGGWVFYSTVVVTRYKLLANLLLERKPEPGKIDKTTLQGAVVYFNTADKPKNGQKDGPQRLRTLWLAGVIDMALADKNLQWDGRTLGELVKAATREELSPNAGTFITMEQWQWIRKVTDFDSRVRVLGGRRALEGFMQQAFSAGPSRK